MSHLVSKIGVALIITFAAVAAKVMCRHGGDNSLGPGGQRSLARV
jgi:hypothetical protein